MFVDAGPGLRIYCDSKSRSLRVAVDTNPIPGWRPLWNEVAAFKSEEEWRRSKFAKMVSSESIQEDIFWFWTDISVEAPI